MTLPTPPPQDHRQAPDQEILHRLLFGYRNTALLYVAAKLNLADLLAGGPRASDELAQTLQAHAPSLHRLLRGLVVLGICSENPDGRFELTGLGAALRSGIEGSQHPVAILNGEEYAPAWNNLLHSAVTGRTAFDHAFGMTPWEHRERNPRLNQCFNSWLGQMTADAAGAILAAYDFSRHRVITDVGGGQGALLAAILKAHASVQGILFDQAHVVATARPALEASGVSGRCRIAAGNFFERIPEGADAFILKSILHDWNDEQCLTILANCHASLKPGQVLIVIERLLPAQAAGDPATIMGDLHMLAVTGGRERSADEYRKLLAAARFELKQIISARSGHCILEAMRA